MLFLDTNAIVYYLHGVEPYAKRFEEIVAGEQELYTSTRVIDETVFVLVRIRAAKEMGIRRISELRRYIERHGYSSFREELRALRELIHGLGVVVLQDEAPLDEMLRVVERYRLLPSDAVIALTCRHYGIQRILTFDEDFRRVPWLRVVG